MIPRRAGRLTDQPTTRCSDAQTNLPTQEAKTVTSPRISRSDADQGGTTGPEGPPPERALPAYPSPGARQTDQLESLTLLKRPYRLRRKQDFQRVRQEGRSWFHPLVILGAAPNDLPYTRIGVTASRRVGKAVRRNRAKRLLREAARRRYDHIQPGWDLVFIARPAIVGCTFHQVDQALEQLLRQAGLLHSPGEKPGAAKDSVDLEVQKQE